MLSTATTLAVFAALVEAGSGHQLANLVGLLAGTVLNTGLNRQWTFGVRGRTGAARHQLLGVALLGVNWLLTAGALLGLQVLDPGAGTLVATVTVAVASAVATALRFLAFRQWMRP